MADLTIDELKQTIELTNQYLENLSKITPILQTHNTLLTEQNKWREKNDLKLKNEEKAAKSRQQSEERTAAIREKNEKNIQNLRKAEVVLLKQGSVLDKQKAKHLDKVLQQEKAAHELAQKKEKLEKLMLQNVTKTNAAHAKRIKDLQDEIRAQEALAAAESKRAEKFKNSTLGKLQSFNSSSTAEKWNMVGEFASNSTKALMENAIGVFEEYTLGVNTRLGSSNAFENMANTISSNLAISPYVEQQKVLDNLNKLVQAGIADNVELRAFLETASEGIATTFSVFDGNLLRLIRLQGKESTAAYLGMEASLTALFNETFRDTSYLSGMYDSVSSAIIDANALLSAEEGLMFSHTVQKWLGAFSEAGASDSFISTLASGLNMLATGNVQGLSQNQSLQSLFAMAAQNTNTSYADMLISGLDSSTTNELMYQLYQYMLGIASGTTDNKVLQNAFGNVFGFNTTDLRALANMQAQADTIYAENLSYDQAVGVTQNQLGTYGSRMNMASMIDNAVANLMFTTGAKMASSPAMNLAYRVAGMLDDFAGGISVEAAPFGIGISTTVADLTRLGLLGASLMTSIPDVLSSIISGGGMNLSGWTSGGYDITAATGSSEQGNFNLSDSTQSSMKDLEKQDIAGTNDKQTDVSMEDIYDELVTIREDIESIDTANPIVVSDIQTALLATKIEELGNTLQNSTFDVNIVNAESNVEIQANVSKFGTDTRSYLTNVFAENIAKRLVNVIYNGKPVELSDEIDSEGTLLALVELMQGLTDNGGSALDINLASSDMVVKDMLVRRV